MTDNEMNGMERDIIDFEDEDGNVIPFEVVDYMFYNGEEYALLTEVTETEETDDNGQECIVCRIVTEQEEDSEENETFVPLEDEELAQKLVDVFNTKMSDEEEE